MAESRSLSTARWWRTRGGRQRRLAVDYEFDPVLQRPKCRRNADRQHPRQRYLLGCAGRLGRGWQYRRRSAVRRFGTVGRSQQCHEPGSRLERPSGWVAGDYHLKSQGWRWSSKDASWVSDDVTSPCIDAGDPASALLSEPLDRRSDATTAVVNTRIDMGAYGGTTEASLAPSNP